MLCCVKYNSEMNDAKANILAAASALFLEGGTRALSVREIAKRGGVSTIGIYSYFQGKQGILDALYIEGFQSVSRAMDVETEGRPPREAVLEASQNYLDNAERYEAYYSLIFSELDGSYMPSAEARDAGEHAFNQLTRLVGSLLPASATQAEKQDAAIQIWSVVHGFVSLKNHAVSLLADMSAWKQRAMRTIETLVDSIEQSGSNR